MIALTEDVVTENWKLTHKKLVSTHAYYKFCKFLKTR